MRQSLAQIEQEFLEQIEQDQRNRQAMQRHAAIRSRQRSRSRERRRSSFRFYMLAASLIFTGLLVTVAMFATLYLLLA